MSRSVVRVPGSSTHALLRVIAVATVVAFSPAITGAQIFPDEDEKCRTNIGKRIRVYSDKVLKTYEYCHKQQRKLNLPLSVDCTDLDDPGFPLNKSEALVKQVGKTAENIVKKCLDAATPTANGYDTCPSPCDLVVPAIVTYTDVSNCLTCLAEDEMRTAVIDAYGSNPDLTTVSNDARKCQESNINTSLRKYTKTRIMEQQRCQRDEDEGDIGSTDCVAVDLRGKIAKAESKLIVKIAKCTDLDLAELTSCGTTVATEQACILAAGQGVADNLFAEVYPVPDPTPTPTPTVTPTATLTVTPTGVLTPTPTPTVTPEAGALFIPPTLTGTLSGGRIHYDLTMDEGTHDFGTGDSTTTAGYNGSILGPTLIMQDGDDVTVNVTNDLADTTTTHWHGLHLPAISDGGPHSDFDPGDTWVAEWTVDQAAATFWYHPHLHGTTQAQVYSGLAGFLIVQDTAEAALTLPRTYGVDDIPLLLQDKTFTAGRQLDNENLAEEMMVNGVLSEVSGANHAFLEAPAQMVRFRALNGSNQRVYELGTSDSRTLYQIATESGLLATANAVTRLRIAPGERMEFMLDLTGDLNDVFTLMSFGSELPNNIPGGGGGGNPLNSADFDILEIRVVAQTASPVTTIPGSLITHPTWDPNDVDVNRTIVMGGGGGGGFTLNGNSFDIGVINDSVSLNDVEIWTIQNDTGTSHPLHLHDMHFFILDIDGNPPPAYLSGPKDTVLVQPDLDVRFITQFLDFSDPSFPFMYHCHILPHEDGGMMGQFVVTDP